jgi:2-polyprenyl-3-methyl-5-hydroxy-6-metoxy-1,4-benzoquinol methylase
MAECMCCQGKLFSPPLHTEAGTYFRCLNCASLGQEAALSGVEQLTKKFEEEQDRFYSEDSVMLSKSFESLQDNATLNRHEIIRKHISSGVLFEVGPGNGKVMALLAKNGFSIEAIEHSEVLANSIEKLTGLPVIHGDFDRFESAKKYDAYMSFHVIEHVPDVMAHLKKAAQITRQGGLAFIATPNACSLQHRVAGTLAPNFSTAHLQLFSEPGLRAVLSTAGWDVIEYYTPEYPVSWLRVLTSLLRRMSNKADAKPRGAYAARVNEKTLMAIRVFGVLTWPIRKLQEKFRFGNELFVVARKR